MCIDELIKKLSKDTDGFKLKVNVGGVVYLDDSETINVVYSISEEYLHALILVEDLWGFIQEKEYNADYITYLYGEQIKFGGSAPNFFTFMKFWQPDINKIIQEYFNDYIPYL